MHGKLWSSFSAAAGAALLVMACSLAIGVAAQTKTTLADLAFISGNWEMVGPKQRVEERWTPPATNAMLGLSRTLREGRMAEFEYLRIVERADGIFYIAQPGGRPATEFKLTKFDGSAAVFENPQHDFPKRIIYRKNADGSLTASIDAGEGTKGPSFSFKPMK